MCTEIIRIDSHFIVICQIILYKQSLLVLIIGLYNLSCNSSIGQLHLMSDNCHYEQNRGKTSPFCVAICLIVVNCKGDCCNSLR